MKQFKWILILMTLSVLFLSCLSGTQPPEDFKKSVQTNSQISDSVHVNTNSTGTDAVQLNKDFIIQFNDKLRVYNVSKFKYYIQGGKTTNTTVTAVLLENKLRLIYTDYPVEWVSTFPYTDVWNRKLLLNGLIITNGNISLHIDKNNVILSITISNKDTYRKYCNILPPKKKSLNTSLKPISYMNNYEVLVKKGNNLNTLIARFNAENKENPTNLSTILRLNPVLRKRKNYYIVPGEILQF